MSQGLQGPESAGQVSPLRDGSLGAHPARRRTVGRLDMGSGLDRLAAFSDAVFAIALTLLALDVRLPEPTRELTGPREVSAYLVDGYRAVLPMLLAYLISFVVIAGAWGMHFRLFRVLHGHTPALVRVNFGLLLVVGLMPFPTSVFARYAASSYANGLYSLALAAVLGLQCALWVVARRSGLLDIPPDQYRTTVRRLAVLTLGFVASAPTGVLSPWAPCVVWLASVVCARWIGRGTRPNST